MKKTMILTSGLLIASAFIFNGCKDDVVEEVPVVLVPAPEVPQAASQMLYLPLNGTAIPSVGSATVFSNTATFTTDRKGTANGAANFDSDTIQGNGQIIEYTGTFIYPSTTFSVWYKVDTSISYPNAGFVYGINGPRGIFCEVASDQSFLKIATCHAIDPTSTLGYDFAPAFTDVMNGGSMVGGQLLFNYNNPAGTGMRPLIENNDWHNLVLTFDASNSYKTVYLDGVKIMQSDLDLNTTEFILNDLAMGTLGNDGAPYPGLDPHFTLGYAGGADNSVEPWTTYALATNTFRGQIDDLRIWSVPLTEMEVGALYNLEK